MNVLIEPAREILYSLGKPKRYKNKTYRLNKFCLIEDIMNGKLIFNGLTRSLIFISNKNFEMIYDKDLINNITNFMYDAYFLVEEDFNEHQFVNEMRSKNIKPIDDYTFKSINEYTILTTTACNARCFYCYEQKVKKSTMSIETANKIVNYILNYANKENEVSLRWFGGEPLFNMKVIDTICEGLTKNNINFKSYFTTNGYLFDEDVIKKAIEVWHCISCQITLDGTEEVYNKAKNYIYKEDKSPYQRVIRNIITLINNNINVGIRMNVDIYNSNNLKDLVYEIFSIIGNHSKLHLYCYPIFENEFYSRTEEERKNVFEKIEEIEKVMDDCGYFNIDNLYHTYKLNLCMADSSEAVTISPNGDLGVCEHCVDYDFMGHIDNPNDINLDVIKSWRVYEKDLSICDNCPNYPFCKRTSKCEEQSKCDEYIKNWKIRSLKQSMRLTYYNILNQQRNNNV